MAKEKTHYVYSTLANDQDYTNYTEAKDRRTDLPSTIGSVRVKGGAGIADKFGVTPQGAVTEVDEDELEMLNANYEFQQHVRRGHLKVTNKEAHVEKVTADMNRDDPSGPATEMDYADQNPGNPAPLGAHAPTTGAVSEEE